MSSHGGDNPKKPHKLKIILQQFFRENDIKVIGVGVPRPYINYSDIDRSKPYRYYHHLLLKLEEYQMLGRPTPTQAVTFSVMLARRHLCVVGKRTEEAQRVTAYLIPILIHICSGLKPITSPRAIILAPTEEICSEIKILADLFGDVMDVRNICIYEQRSSDLADQFTNVGLVIATPVRLLNAIKDKKINVGCVSTIVFDELDEMFQLGYYSSIDRLMEFLEMNVQVSVFCSTLPLDVRIYNTDYLASDYVQIIVGKAHLTRTPLQNTAQNVHICEQHEKPEILFQLLRTIIEGDNKRTVVFAEENFGLIHEYLVKKRLPVLVLKDIVDEAQKYTLNKFKDRHCNQILLTKSQIFQGPAMVLPGLKNVIIVDFPTTCVAEARYIHQVSLAGFTSEIGIAHTFLTSSDACKAQEIIDILKECDQPIYHDLYDLASKNMNLTEIPKKRLTLFDILPVSDVEEDNISLAPSQRPQTPQSPCKRSGSYREQSRSPLRARRRYRLVRERSRLKSRSLSALRALQSRSPRDKRRRQKSRSPAALRSRQESRSPQDTRTRVQSRLPLRARSRQLSRSPRDERRRQQSRSPLQEHSRQKSSPPLRGRSRQQSRSPQAVRSQERSRLALQADLRQTSRLPHESRSRQHAHTLIRSHSYRPKSPSVEPLPIDALLALRIEVDTFYHGGRHLADDAHAIEALQNIIPPTLLNLLAKNGFERLPKLHEKIWLSLAQRANDLMVITPPTKPAQRILSYLLPAIVHIIDRKSRYNENAHAHGPICIILVPTTEMVDNVHLLAKKFCDPFQITEIAIGTPNMIVQIEKTDNKFLSRCDYLVFDELHQMLDDGMIDELETIHRVSGFDRGWKSHMAYSSQLTIHEHLFCKDFLKSNHTVLNLLPTNVGSKSAAAFVTTFSGVQQFVEIVLKDNDMRPALTNLLCKVLRNQKNETPFKILIFVGRNASQSFLDKIQNQLPLWAPRILCLDNDKTQDERQTIMNIFHSSCHQILFTNDAMAKLIDKTNVKLIINYEYPVAGKMAEYVYLHRICQSDKHQADRMAITFLTPSDASIARHLIGILELMEQPINPLLQHLTIFEDTHITDQSRLLLENLVETKTFHMIGDMRALLLYLETKYPNAFPSPPRSEKFNELEAKHSKISVTTSSSTRVITQKLTDLAEPELTREEYDDYRAFKLREAEEKKSGLISSSPRRRPSQSTSRRITETSTNRKANYSSPQKLTDSAEPVFSRKQYDLYRAAKLKKLEYDNYRASKRQLEEKNAKSGVVSASSSRKQSHAIRRRTTKTYTNKKANNSRPQQLAGNDDYEAAKLREAKQKNSGMIPSSSRRRPSTSKQSITKPIRKTHTNRKSINPTVDSTEPVFSRAKYDEYRAAKLRQEEEKKSKSGVISPSLSRRSSKLEGLTYKETKYSRINVTSPSSNRRPQKTVDSSPQPSPNKSATSRRPPESSANAYYNFTPKLVINNQFINTSMSTFKPSERSQYKSSHVSSLLSDDDVQNSLPVPPPPPKVDFHAIREKELKLNRRDNDYGEGYGKRAKLPDQTNLTNSVSAFLDKLTDKFGNN